MNMFFENVVREVENPSRGSHLNILVPESKVVPAQRALAICGMRFTESSWIDESGRTVKLFGFLSPPEKGPFVICNGGEDYPEKEHKALLAWYAK
jgi:hypothetical protein